TWLLGRSCAALALAACSAPSPREPAKPAQQAPVAAPPSAPTASVAAPPANYTPPVFDDDRIEGARPTLAQAGGRGRRAKASPSGTLDGDPDDMGNDVGLALAPTRDGALAVWGTERGVWIAALDSALKPRRPAQRFELGLSLSGFDALGYG